MKSGRLVGLLLAMVVMSSSAPAQEKRSVLLLLLDVRGGRSEAEKSYPGLGDWLATPR